MTLVVGLQDGPQFYYRYETPAKACAIRRTGLAKRPTGRPLARYGPIAVYARVPGLRVVFRNGEWEVIGVHVARRGDRWADADCGGFGTIVEVAATSVISGGKPVATVGDKVFAPAIARGCPRIRIPSSAESSRVIRGSRSTGGRSR